MSLSAALRPVAPSPRVAGGDLSPRPAPGRFLRALVLGGAALGLIGAGAATAAGSRSLSYEDAVRKTRAAAQAVLDRAGPTYCLRGKLNRALLGLSASCDASGKGNALCALADKAAVVTPMDLSFMDETSRQLLELTSPTAAQTP
jgi:hypothetical protein